MESDFKQSEQAQHLAKVSCYTFCMNTSLCACGHLVTPTVCLQQKEEGTCLGSSLTAADAAYVISSSQLSAPEEGDAPQ